jgi:hypothetical protein
MECITLWDVRAKAPVYDLATGNNSVTGIAWNDERNELFAATWCSNVDRNGCHIDYEPAKIPVDKNTDGEDGEGGKDNEDDWEDDEGDGDEVEYEDTDQCWPRNAYHNETYFGHIFDSGDHRICGPFSLLLKFGKLTQLLQTAMHSKPTLIQKLSQRTEELVKEMVGSKAGPLVVIPLSTLTI